MTYETLLVESTGKITTITVNRPDALNALNATVLSEIYDVATKLSAENDADVVILTGAGRAFVAGADIKAMLNYKSEEAEAFSKLGHKAFSAFATLPMPTIAAINGFALGGGLELALSCDILYGSEKARLGLPEVSLGVIPGWGGTQRLSRMIGLHAAKELVLTGDTIRADRAKEIGLIRDIFPLENFMEEIQKIAQNIVSRGPLATRAAKRSMNQGIDLSLQEGLEAEQKEFGGLFGTHDQVEGMNALLEKRKANFKGE